MKQQILATLVLCILFYNSGVSQNGEFIFLTAKSEFFDSLEAQSRYDLSNNYVAKAMNTRGRRNDASGEFSVFDQLRVIKVSYTTEGEKYFMVSPLDNTKKKVWIRAKNFTKEDPRIFFKLKTGARAFEGYVIVNNSSIYEKDPLKIKFIDDLLGEVSFSLKDCVKIKTGTPTEIVLRVQENKTETLSGKFHYSSDDLFLVSGNIEIKLIEKDKAFELTPLNR